MGRVLETRGRKVRVADDAGDRDCFLSGHRVVVGDRVKWVPARGTGGKIVEVLPRTTALRRMDHKGREQILAANLEGLLVVVSVQEPGFRAALLHRYYCAAQRDGLRLALVLSKVDLGVPTEVDEHLALLGDEIDEVFHVSSTGGEGVADVAAFLANTDEPWALVGSSGVGKTSLIAALLPNDDVGPIGDISEFWGTGRHTTTHTRVFELPGGGTIVDSPGIRNLTPVITDPYQVCLHFPVVRHVRCAYRNCQHREGEDGCIAEQEVPAALLDSYRHLLADVTQVQSGQRH